MDEEQRFYLQSRGYPAQEAAKLLAKDFVYDLIEDQAPLVKNFFDDALSEALHQVEEAQ